MALRSLVLALAVGAVVLSGCSGDSRDDGAVRDRRPVAYQPEGFDDLPLERLRGYRLAADHEPLAVAFAGGALRRFDVVFVSTTDEPENPRTVLDRLAGGLTERGWVRLPVAPGEDPEAAPERYRKGGEEVSVQAEIDSRRTMVTWRLTKAAPTPAP